MSPATIARSVVVGQQTSRDFTGDEVEYDTLRVLAEDVIMELSEHGIVPNTEAALLTSSTDRGGSEWRFGFSAQVAGVPVLGMWIYVTLDRNGERRSIELHDVSVDVVGQAVAAVDESSADRRFLELAQSDNPDSVIVFHTSGRAGYLVPHKGASVDVEPVWAATWSAVHRTEPGIIGPRRTSSLSLTDPSAKLLHGPAD